MKFILSFFVLASSTFAFGGDATAIYTLVIDGVSVVYDLGDLSVEELGDDGSLTITQNNQSVFATEYDVDKGTMGLTVYVDPRQGTVAEHGITATPLTVQLKCKDFWPNP